MRNARLDEAQAEIKIAGKNINNLRYADDTTVMAEIEEELKSFLMKVKEESEKVGVKLNTQKTKIMAPDPITSWQIDGETVADFIFWVSIITTDGDCSHEIKRHLLLGGTVTANLDSILKNRDITLPTKVHLVKAMVFLVVKYGCENWTWNNRNLLSHTLCSCGEVRGACLLVQSGMYTLPWCNGRRCAIVSVWHVRKWVRGDSDVCECA